MARRSRARRSPPGGAATTGEARGGGGAGSVRARWRLVAAALLGLLSALSLVLAVRLYFFLPSRSVAASGVVALLLGVGALVYGLLARAVLKQSRGGHILAVVVCLSGAVLSVSVAMAWPDWAALVGNVVAAGLLLGCVPRRATAGS